jgi:hypothetical protein
LDRSTMADWVGKSTALLEPLADAIGKHIRQGQALFADDTPIKMLAPGQLLETCKVPSCKCIGMEAHQCQKL